MSLHFSEYDTRLAAYAVIIDEGAVLLTWYNGLRRGEPGWSLPGGGVEYDESCEQAAVREITEETGYRARLGRLLTVDSFQAQGEPDLRGGRPYKALRVIFTASITAGTLGTLEVGGSTDEARWFPLDEVPRLTRSGLVDVGLTAWRERDS